MSTFSWNDLKQAADEAGFSTVPDGLYDVFVKTAEAKKTGTGKDKITVRFTISSGPFANKPLFNDFVISPESGVALGFFFRHMKALGLGPEYFATNPDLKKVAADLVGKHCQVDVGTRTWQDQERNEIKGVKPPTGGNTGMPQTSGGTPQPQVAVAKSQSIAQPQPQPQPQPATASQPVAQPQPVTQVTPQPSVTESVTEAQETPVEDVVIDGATSDTVVPPEVPF